MNKYIKTIIFTLCMTIIACSKTQNKPQGGQDSGGGDTTVSSLEDVEYYYNRIIPILPKAMEYFFSDWTINKFNSDEKRKLLIQAREKIIATQTNSNLLEALTKLVSASAINIKKDTSCSSIDKTHSSASIKEFQVGSPICLSFYSLTKVPISSLEREIISLLLHEYLHAVGYKEEIASTIQKYLINNYDFIFPDGAKRFIARKRPEGAKHPDPAGSLSRIAGLLDTFINADENERFVRHDPETKTWTKFIYNSQDWRYDCLKMEHAVLMINELQTNHISKWLRLGPRLVAANKISAQQIEERMDRSDELKYNMSERLGLFWHNCRFSYTKLQQQADGNPKIVPKSVNDLKKIANLLILDIKEFLSLIEESKDYQEKYN